MFKTRLDTFGNDFGHFWIFENFLIFLKIFEDSTVHGTLGKKVFRKNHLKICSKHVWTLLGTILGILGILKYFLIILKNFEDSTLHGTLGKSFVFEKKTPENMFKTRLDTFGNDFGLFWIFENFLIFLKIFEDSTLHGTLGKSFVFEKNTPKHVQNTFGHFWERFWAFLDF